MAVISAKKHIDDPSGRVTGYHWPAVTENDTCGPVRIPEHDDVTISIHDTPGGSSTALHISSESETTGYYAAKDANTASAIALTTADTGALVSEVAVWYKPVITGGSSQNLDIMVVAK